MKDDAPALLRFDLQVSISERTERLLLDLLGRALPVLERLAHAMEAAQPITVRPPEAPDEESGASISEAAVSAPSSRVICEPNLAAKVWTEERLDALRKCFRIDGNHAHLLSELNRFDGREIVTVEAMLIKARELGLGDALADYFPAPVPSVFRRPKNPNMAHQGVVKWTAERLDLVRSEMPLDSQEKRARVLARVNALPGPPITSVTSMMTKLNTMPWFNSPAPTLPAAITPPSPTKVVPAEATAQAPEFSEGRTAVLRRMYERGDLAENITAALNKLPGPVLAEKRVIQRAAALALKRPRVVQPKTERITDDSSVPATAADVRNWLKQAGRKDDAPADPQQALRVANDLRAALELPPFRLVDHVFGGNMDYTPVRVAG